jgi:hypothetical protein
MLLPSVIIDQARGLHPAFDRQSHPNLTLLQDLDSYQRELWPQVLIRHPTIAAEEQVIPTPLSEADQLAGVALTMTLAILSAEIRVLGMPGKFALIPPDAKAYPQYPASGWIDAGRLYLRGTVQDWNGIDSVVIRYADQPAELVAMSTPLALPDQAIAVCKFQLAMTMAGRGTMRPGVPPPNVNYFQGKHADAEIKFLESLWLQSSNAPFYIREDF